jgi:uncharacterized membrane protein
MDSRIRHIAKSITWRIIASATTFALAMFFFGDDPEATKKATWVALSETFLKMFLYYFHERAWFKVNIGLDKRKSEQS